MKKLVLLLTVILLALCLTSCEKSAKGFDYYVNWDGTTCTITGIDSSLPEWLEWLEDEGILYGDKNYSSNLTIPKYLNGYTVTKIDSGAFRGCSSLKSVVIPDSVTSIGYDAFEDCYSLTDVYIDDIGSWCKIIFDNGYANPLNNGANLYLNGRLVTEINPSNNISTIKNFAFYGCKSLTNVVIPDSVISIGWSAFCYCNALTNVVIPESVTKIDNYAFYDCNSLEIIYIPKSVTSIVVTAFGRCNSLYDISVSESNPNYKDINGNIFTKDGKTLVKYAAGKKDTAFIIPDSVTIIDNYAFSNCSALTSITIPDSVTSIGDSAFEDCYSLTSITIPDSVTSIGDYAFYNCDSLTSITIPDSVTSIGGRAFQGCRSLTSIEIPDGVTSIGDWAFNWCSDLYIVYNNSNLNLTIGDESYGGIAKYATVIVNKNGMISVDDGNKYILTDDGFLFRYKQGEYTLIAYDGRESKVTLPEKINGSSYSLESVKGLTEVIIPEIITSIEYNSFDSNLTSITIPASVTSIDPNALLNCARLKSIEVNEENTVYRSIDGNLYTKEGNLLILYARGKADTQCVVPKEVMKIGEKAFANIKTIKSVVIHKDVTNIADSAFSKCENLEYVYFTGTQEEWKNIIIGENNDYLIEAIIVYEYVPE